MIGGAVRDATVIGAIIGRVQFGTIDCAGSRRSPGVSDVGAWRRKKKKRHNSDECTSCYFDFDGKRSHNAKCTGGVRGRGTLLPRGAQRHSLGCAHD
jgi:hypothetical protein